MEEKNNIVVSNTKAYGYNYASLSDIAKQGFTIPKMKTGTDNGKEYVYYYDQELKEWIRGAEIIVPDMKGMNQAQKYGAGITFARRYSVLLYLGLTSDDDERLESAKSGVFDEPTDQFKNANVKALADEFRKLYPVEEQARILNGLHLTRAEDVGMVDLQKYINFMKYGKQNTN